MENVIHWVEHKDDSPPRAIHHLPPDPTANWAIRNMEREERKKKRAMRAKQQERKANTDRQEQTSPKKEKKRKHPRTRVWRAKEAKPDERK